jgi:hypothetical protein
MPAADVNLRVLVAQRLLGGAADLLILRTRANAPPVLYWKFDHSKGAAGAGRSLGRVR